MPIKIAKSVPWPVSILMPVRNEADIIEQVIEEWVSEVFQHLPEGSEFLLDDAASADGTQDILRRLSQKYSFLQVRFNERPDGFAAAARRLYASAKCPLVFFTDSDGQYVASEFWKLIPCVRDYDVVHGVKLGRQDTFLRKAASGAFNHAARFIFDIYLNDINCAFRIFKREVIDDLLPQAHCMPVLFNAELLLRADLANYSIKRVWVLHRRRKFGVSRGLPPWKFFYESFRSFRGLLQLKEEYRARNLAL